MLWSSNLTYWLGNSLDVGYQNQSTAWLLSGKNINFDGHGYGTFDGNGWAWYDKIHDSNHPRRPHALTVTGTEGGVFKGLRFLRSQMWSLSVIHSKDLLFEDFYVNNLDEKGQSSPNTDGADTIYSSNITFNNWDVTNGDDSISAKANSTDITITNSILRKGLGIAIGSIGQYDNQVEIVERLRVNNVTFKGTQHAVYFKTWTGEAVGVPPNGGGGGLGHASNNTFTNLHLKDLRGTPFTISQCTTYDGANPNCTSSKFQVRDEYFANITGSQKSGVIASFQCSAVAPCKNIQFEDVSIKNGSEKANQWLCGHFEDPKGWKCTGKACEGPSDTGGC
ncbi:hypothetical protein KEM55_002649 [Ascosphaera atra]|nr:hypothetical protein KEM55_002649 [Ascosphaera atra]